jgi:hypothetical protein
VFDPLTEHFFQVSSWQFQSFLSTNVASIAVLAVVVQLCVYCTVRYSIYLSAEFDELTDGVVYATAAGIGSATVLNLNLLLASDTLTLSGSTLMMATVLIHVAAAYPLGIGLAKLRFGQGTSLMMGGFFLVSIIINGIGTELMITISSAGTQFKPWSSLLICTGLAGIILVIGARMIDQLQQKTMQLVDLTLTKARPFQDIWVWLLSVVFLAGAHQYSRQLISGDHQIGVLDGQVELYLPLGWNSVEEADRFMAKPIGFGQMKPNLKIHRVKTSPKKDQPLLEVADIELLSIEEQHRAEGTSFRITKTEEKVAFGGHPSIWSWFAIVLDPDQEHGVPTVMIGVDAVIIVTERSEVYAVSAWGTKEDWERGAIEQLINGVVIQ